MRISVRQSIKDGLVKVRLAEVFESSTPTLAPPLVRLATWAANIGHRVNALIKGGINGNTERNDGRNKDAGSAVPDSRITPEKNAGNADRPGRSGDTSAEFGAVVGALSESHNLPSNDPSVVNHSGRAPPVSAIIITAAIIFFLSVLLSEAFGQDNQAIINLIQPAIDPSVAGNQLTANVVKGGAGALLQGLTPLVAAFTTKLGTPNLPIGRVSPDGDSRSFSRLGVPEKGGVRCALLNLKSSRLSISLTSLRRILHLWLQGRIATTILEYSSSIMILAPFIPAMAELILGRSLEAGSGIISLAASLPLGIAFQSTGLKPKTQTDKVKVLAIHLDTLSTHDRELQEKLYGKFDTLIRKFGEENSIEILADPRSERKSGLAIKSSNGTLTLKI